MSGLVFGLIGTAFLVAACTILGGNLGRLTTRTTWALVVTSMTLTAVGVVTGTAALIGVIA